MKRSMYAISVLVVSALMFACTSEKPVAPTAQNDNAIPLAKAGDSDRHLVMFKGNGVPNGFAAQVAALGGTVDYSHNAGIAIVSGLSDDAAATLAADKKISDVQADASFELDAFVDSDGATAADGSVASPGDPTTAFFYARQWNMRAVSADQAWANGRLGSSNVTLAILDTGIDYTYPDLNGRVDLSRSASFVSSDDALVAAFFPGKHVVTDLHYHGTHVASTAVSNSNVIAGVTSQTTLIGVKVCNVNGSCPFSSVIAGVLHAVDNGADVINMSLGGAFTKAGNGQFVGFINKVFNQAKSAGVTVVVSAGNAGADLDHNGNVYATYCDAPNVLCIAATGPTSWAGVNGPWTDVDNPAGYTNYGRSAINVAAPGGTGSFGSVWSACSQTSLLIPICQTGTFIVGLSGTSMSAPHVSGLASLMVEDVGRNPGQVRARIQQSADDLGQPGTDPFYGKGRINVGAAVGN